MPTTSTTGRLLYAAALISLGLKMIIVAGFPADLIPIPKALPGYGLLASVSGLVLLLSGVGIARQVRRAALLAAGLFGVFALVLHLPLLLSNPGNGGEWTVFFEHVALGSGALLVARSFVAENPAAHRTGPAFALSRYGVVLFAASLVVFGVLHFRYANYIATLIPAWIPGPLFWAYFVGVAFFATAASLLLNRQVWLAGTLLGTMFLLWVMLLHAPRALAAPHVEPEWTSLLIALGMSGISFALVDVLPSRQSADNPNVITTSIIT